MAQEFEKPYCEHCAARLESVLSDVEGENLAQISSTKGCTIYRKGQAIFSEGETATGIFCVHSGKAKLFKTGEEGKHQIVRFAKPGDTIGYRALMSGDVYSVSAAALEDSIVCTIPKLTFFDVLKHDGALSMRVIRLLSSELGKAEEQILHLAQKPVRERLAEALLLLREVYGTENGDNSPINVALSREELASVVGTAIETLVRTLSDLKRENLIKTEKKKIRILDVPGLLRVSNLQD